MTNVDDQTVVNDRTGAEGQPDTTAGTREAVDVVADLGGTNVRFAVARGLRQIDCIEHLRLDTFEDFAAALTHYRSTVLGGANVRRLAIGAAGPVDEGRVTLTNAASWSLDASELARSTQDGVVVIVNDLQAVSRAIPELSEIDIQTLRGQRVALTAGRTALAINVGTGFGASAIHAIATGEASAPLRFHASATEAGHITAPIVGAAARVGDGRAPPEIATFEDLLSGRGLRDLANTLADPPQTFASAADVVINAKAVGADAALRAFGWMLGCATRDLVLAHGAWAGVYLVGSVVTGWLTTPGARDMFEMGYAGIHRNSEPVDEDMSEVGSAFEISQPRNPMWPRLAKVPVMTTTCEYPALVGLAAMLEER